MGLRKKLRTLFSKKASYPVHNGVTFIHHTPTRGNIGDFLCSPRHYFHFTVSKEPLTIIGGGVFPNYGLKKLEKEKLDPDLCILWGVGVSIREGSQDKSSSKKLPYAAWGIRDKDALSSDDDNHFLPCVSCLHPMLDAQSQSPQTNTLLFLNADTKVTTQEALINCKKVAKNNNWHFLLNNCSENEFRPLFEDAHTVITNSYHGAYWGLLSGKKVILFGYSSKFKSLLSNFDVDITRLNQIKRGDTDSLLKALNSIDISKDVIQLPNHQATLSAFRNRNLAFAEELKKRSLIRDYNLIF